MVWFEFQFVCSNRESSASFWVSQAALSRYIFNQNGSGSLLGSFEMDCPKAGAALRSAP
jgi:hypothetical protein